MEGPVQYHAAVAAVGQRLEDLRGPAAQLRGETILQGGVGIIQGIHGQADGFVFSLQLPAPLVHGLNGGLEDHRVSQGVESAGEPVGGGAGGFQLCPDLG